MLEESYGMRKLEDSKLIQVLEQATEANCSEAFIDMVLKEMDRRKSLNKALSNEEEDEDE